MNPLIQLTDVTRVYGRGDAEVRALAGVSLTIHEGEFLAVMGPSGSGKSTCMNLLGCLDRPTAGSHRFRGVEVSTLSLDQLALLRRHYLGFVFQGFNLLARTSAMENVELPLVYRRVPAAERRVLAQKALTDVGLKGREGHTPAELSGGQQQRVAIARAIVTNPAMLLADEPTGNLDSARKEEIMRLLIELNRERGITVVMVTHEPDMAAYASRIVTFRDGLVERDEPGARAEAYR
ncbi:ABC transporter ATP-binding protein [Chondromyces apiculatus]|uniref:ABC transporter related protein n=1 Tax=Chondromyces apiculatus DSM 436 TaxID=1192034 RepID=A0A017TI35_9BACT|nr:ABC transporter ATP-binding protein [Chondromyces apiculatus]EYF08495.1 ABC transporter related protein [Chondromyces apiculatus DSM 436]